MYPRRCCTHQVACSGKRLSKIKAARQYRVALKPLLELQVKIRFSVVVENFVPSYESQREAILKVSYPNVITMHVFFFVRLSANQLLELST